MLKSSKSASYIALSNEDPKAKSQRVSFADLTTLDNKVENPTFSTNIESQIGLDLENQIYEDVEEEYEDGEEFEEEEEELEEDDEEEEEGSTKAQYNEIGEYIDEEEFEVVKYEHQMLQEIPIEKNKAPVPLSPKTLNERHRLEFWIIVGGGIALAFNSGFINGITYQFGNMPVTHITGTTTHAGLSLGAHDFEHFSIYLAMILCFVFGSGITGYIIPKDSFQLGREYGPLFVIGSSLLLLAWSSNYWAPKTNVFFYLSSMASGLQNGLTTKYSGSIIRTTHMTGAGTDIGLTIGRFISSLDGKELWRLYVLIPLLCSFMFGGAVSIHAYRRWGAESLLINVVVFFSIGLVYSVLVGQELHIPFWRAFFGYYQTVERHIQDGHKKATEAVRNVHGRIKNMKMDDVNPLHAGRHVMNKLRRKKSKRKSSRMSMKKSTAAAKE